MLGSTRRRFSQSATVGLSICLALFPKQIAAQNASLEFQLKAAFLFNFAKFVEWPSQAFPRPDAPFNICLAGDPFQGSLDQTVEGERLNGRPLMVRRLVSNETIRECHLVYVAPSEARRSAEIVSAAMNLPILTVGDSDDFINVGGMIRFTEIGRRIRFEINPAAAERVQLKVSSRLLRLAEIVRPRRAGAQF